MELHRFALLMTLLAASGCATVPAPEPVTPQQRAAVPAYLPKAIAETPPTPAATNAKQNGVDLLAYATGLLGVHYRLGGSSPRNGFDCSGFVQYVYRQGGIELPHNSRAMARSLPAIASPEKQPGDLVFFRIGGRAHSHVGIYLGENQFVHATSHRTNSVMISRLDDAYWRKRLDGIRRPGLSAGHQRSGQRALAGTADTASPERVTGSPITDQP